MRVDVVVLGAGIVGVSAALHLAARGRSVAVVDRRGPGEETSYGNAGLIQCEAYLPYTFPQGLATLVRYALNRESETHYHLASLPKIAPFLYRYWRNASPARVALTIRANRPLFDHSLSEHVLLAAEAGMTAIMRRGGWVQLCRKQETLARLTGEAERLKRDFGVTSAMLDARALATIEPHLSLDKVAGAIHWQGPVSLRDPLALTMGYAELLKRRGGQFVAGDARTLAQSSEGWTVTTSAGTLSAKQALVCLGPWSSDIFLPLGYAIPLGVKRGYHIHYRAAGNATLNHTVIDTDTGFAMAAMTKGIRMTTGAEFAGRDAPPTPVQIERCEPKAREIFPLADRAEATPWLGRRPVMPDMIPVIGEAPRHPGLWFNFGHAHHGLTNAAVCGRLVSELMTGEAPFCDPTPFRPDRNYV
jgi:D-amino-acid dehydrogenase